MVPSLGFGFFNCFFDDFVDFDRFMLSSFCRIDGCWCVFRLKFINYWFDN